MHSTYVWKSWICWISSEVKQWYCVHISVTVQRKFHNRNLEGNTTWMHSRLDMSMLLTSTFNNIMTKCFSSTEMSQEKCARNNLQNGVSNHVHDRWEVDDKEGGKPSRVVFLNKHYTCLHNLHRKSKCCCALTIYHHSEACILLTQHVQHTMLHLWNCTHGWKREEHIMIKPWRNVAMYQSQNCVSFISWDQWTNKQWEALNFLSPNCHCCSMRRCMLQVLANINPNTSELAICRKVKKSYFVHLQILKLILHLPTIHEAKIRMHTNCLRESRTVRSHKDGVGKSKANDECGMSLCIIAMPKHQVDPFFEIRLQKEVVALTPADCFLHTWDKFRHLPVCSNPKSLKVIIMNPDNQDCMLFVNSVFDTIIEIFLSIFRSHFQNLQIERTGNLTSLVSECPCFPTPFSKDAESLLAHQLQLSLPPLVQSLWCLYCNDGAAAMKRDSVLRCQVVGSLCKHLSQLLPATKQPWALKNSAMAQHKLSSDRTTNCFLQVLIWKKLEGLKRWEETPVWPGQECGFVSIAAANWKVELESETKLANPTRWGGIWPWSLVAPSPMQPISPKTLGTGLTHPYHHPHLLLSLPESAQLIPALLF